MYAERRVAVTDTRDQFRALFDEQLSFVRRIARWQGVRPADLDDVCQEVFVVVHRKLPEYEGRSSIKGWLYGICWRVCQDWRSRAHVRYEQTTATAPEVVVAASQLKRLETAEAFESLMDLLEGIDEDHRTVFLLYEVEMLSMKEIAAAVGCPLFTGYSRLRAARAEVRRGWQQRKREGRA